MGEIKRRELLLKIAERGKVDKVEDESQYTIIKEVLHLVKKELSLDTSIDTIKILEEKGNLCIPGCITSVQNFCMNVVWFNLREKKIQGAYNELYDFIGSCNKLEMQELNTTEKLLILFLANSIEMAINEYLKTREVNKVCIAYGGVAFIGVKLAKTAEAGTIDILKQGVRLTAVKMKGCHFKFTGTMEGFKTYSMVDNI